MGTTRRKRAKDPGGCGGEDRGLWGSGGRLSPHNRASRRGDSRLGRADRSGSDRHGSSGDRRDKEGTYGQRLRLGCPARTLPRDGGARGVRPRSRTLGAVLYSPECVEGVFSEVRRYGVLENRLSKHPQCHHPHVFHASFTMSTIDSTESNIDRANAATPNLFRNGPTTRIRPPCSPLRRTTVSICSAPS